MSRTGQDLQRLEDEIVAVNQVLQDTRDELRASQATHADGEARKAALLQDATEQATRLTNELDEARRLGAERGLQLDHMQQRVNELERELSHTVERLESADQRSTSAEHQIAKLDSELELSARENQTLRRLGQSSVAEAEALAAEVAGLKHGQSLSLGACLSFSHLQKRASTAELQQVHLAKQAELKAAHEEATRNLTEVITELEKRERGQLAAENHARQLEVELEHVRAALQGHSPEDQARIAELEKVLDARMLDVEEADEKLIEVSAFPKSCFGIARRG